MATKNAIDSNIPIEVTKGGTGAATFTANGVLYGNTTSAVQVTGSGVTGQLLVATSSSAPKFDSSADGNFTFVCSAAGTTRKLEIRNTDNTNAASASQVLIDTGGSSAGDPYVGYQIAGVTDFTTGIDNSDSDNFKISASSALGTTDTFVMTKSGERTLPLQPAFLAYLANDASNVTGDGTAYTVLFDTKVFDVGTHYNTGTGVFTAPVTGTYQLSSTIQWNGLTSTSVFTGGTIVINTSNRTYTGSANPAKYFVNATNIATVALNTLADMDAADTVTIIGTITGSSKTISADGAAAPTTFFSGTLVC